MARYLNSQTREDAVVISGAVGALKGIADRWLNTMKNPPKEVIAYVRASSRFAARSLKELDKELDDYELQRLYKMAETTRFQLAYTKCDLSSKTKGIITYDITEDERDNLVEALAEVRCSSCDGCVKNCTVRSQFFKWDVTPVYEMTDDKHPCQYMPPEDI